MAAPTRRHAASAPEPATKASGPGPALHVTSRAEWRRWLKANSKRESEVWLVFYKQHTGKPRIAYDDALEEALCFGWIDAMVRRIDDERYAQRFTPRRPSSGWSERNLAIVKRLTEEGRMTKAGLAALGPDPAKPRPARRPPDGSTLHPQFAAALRRNGKAWTNFRSLAPSYQGRYLAWINDAKTDATRNKRIAEAVRLIADGVKSIMK